MDISELSALTGLAPSALRFYEAQGLLPAALTERLTPETENRSSVPAPTRTRWRTRLRERAAVLVAVLGTCSQHSVVERALALGSGALRREVVDAFGGLAALPGLAALVHRLVRGVRVM